MSEAGERNGKKEGRVIHEISLTAKKITAPVEGRSFYIV
jgi:hypothetical protein